MAKPLSIGRLAARTGVKIPTIRYYEAEGLMPPAPRTDAGRRTYGEPDVERLSFLRHARALGFDLDAIRELLALSDQPNQPCAEVDRLARQHRDRIVEHIERLTRLRMELDRMIEACGRGQISHCNIIRVLGDHSHCATEH
jgi:DNA-binding transcriptional MerR regulator